MATSTSGYAIDTLSIAVLVNRASLQAMLGDKATPDAVQKQLAEIEQIVSSAAGVKKERGDTVKLSGFGVFQVREKRARMGRNPKTGEPAAINPRRVISFRASQIMKSRVHDAVVED